MEKEIPGNGAVDQGVRIQIGKAQDEQKAKRRTGKQCEKDAPDGPRCLGHGPAWERVKIARLPDEPEF